MRSRWLSNNSLLGGESENIKQEICHDGMAELRKMAKSPSVGKELLPPRSKQILSLEIQSRKPTSVGSRRTFQDVVQSSRCQYPVQPRNHREIQSSCRRKLFVRLIAVRRRFNQATKGRDARNNDRRPVRSSRIPQQRRKQCRQIFFHIESKVGLEFRNPDFGWWSTGGDKLERSGGGPPAETSSNVRSAQYIGKLNDEPP